MTEQCINAASDNCPTAEKMHFCRNVIHGLQSKNDRDSQDGSV
jgi:hypothetical protein